jgi:hypothetical protein
MQLTRNALNMMSHALPSAQSMVDIFEGSWYSRLPDVAGSPISSGTTTLFDDARIRWAAEQAGGFAGKRILELGPLEGGHSYMMSQMGARHVTSIEANARLFLKCLATKELYGLNNCTFLFGDFLQYMRQTPQNFDFCLASGVLYHMANPVELLSLIAKVTQRAMLWTQYYDRDVIRQRMPLYKRVRFRRSRKDTYNGFSYTRNERRYGLGLHNLHFIGGGDSYSCWMNLDDIVGALKFFGFKKVEMSFHDKEHVNGPAVCLACSKD